MHYLNPAFFLGESFQLPFDVKTLQRERKRLLVELELGDGDSIALNGRSFTKDELIGYFEELQREDIAAYHLAISKDPALLGFLQHAAIEEGARFKDADMYNDPNFINWISPYFRTTFIQLTKDCFELPDAAKMRTILDNKLLMTANDTEQAWQLIDGLLEKNIALFDHYRGRGQKTSPPMMPLTKISALIGHGYIEVIRQLPDSRFARTKNNYAFNMQHPAIAVFNRDLRNRSLAIIWLEEALTLAVSEDIKKRIQAKLDELNRLQKKMQKRRIGRVIFIILIGVGTANGFLNSSNNTYHSNSTLSSPTYKVDSSTILELPDSVIVREKKRDSAHRHQHRPSSP